MLLEGDGQVPNQGDPDLSRSGDEQTRSEHNDTGTEPPSLVERGEGEEQLNQNKDELHNVSMSESESEPQAARGTAAMSCAKVSEPLATCNFQNC
jgi:hypothetical protein